MINFVNIENYRNLKSLEIRDLARVNLFVGKNNTGKTSVLEAISLLAINKDLNVDDQALVGWLYKMAYNRDRKAFTTNDMSTNNFTNINLQILSSLIYNRDTDYFGGFVIRGQELRHNRYGEDIFNIERVELRFHPSVPRQVTIIDDEGNSKMRYEYLPISSKEELEKVDIPKEKWTKFLQLQGQSGPRAFGRTMDVINKSGDIMAVALSKIYRSNVQFVTTKDFDEDTSIILYDRIIFEQYKIDQVHNALRLIEPLLEKFAFQSIDSGQRVGRIKLTTSSELLSLGNMGDGMNRILNIILAAVNCQNGYLFIDEFENGLHYSVQKNLWEILFFLTEALNVQIFATTHSNDAINSMAEVLETKKGNKSFGKAFRLQKNKEKILIVDYSENELETSSNLGIEIR